MMNTWGRPEPRFKSQRVLLSRRTGTGPHVRASPCSKIDDGWQSGRRPNSKSGNGSSKDIWNNPDYWSPDPVKYPRGLFPIVEKARELASKRSSGSIQAFKTTLRTGKKTQMSSSACTRSMGIRIFKIDGLRLPTKRSEENLRKLFDKVPDRTGPGDRIRLNLGRKNIYARMAATPGSSFPSMASSNAPPPVET